MGVLRKERRNLKSVLTQGLTSNVLTKGIESETELWDNESEHESKHGGRRGESWNEKKLLRQLRVTICVIAPSDFSSEAPEEV